MRRDTATARVGFQTGPIEPKLAALDEIARRRDGSRKTIVVTGGWSSYWAIRYLLYGDESYATTAPYARWDRREPTDLAHSRLSSNEVEHFYVDFVGGWLDERMRQQPGLQRIEISGYGGHPVMAVYVPVANPTQ